MPKLTTVLMAVAVLWFAKIASADVVIDNFTCSDSLSMTGEGPFNNGFDASYVACPGAIGGNREDFMVIPSSGVSATAVTTMSSNPPAGAVTGTFGSGVSHYEGMQWGVVGGKPGFDLNLDLVGDTLQFQIQSDSAGSLLLFFGQTFTNSLMFTATFSGGPSYQDVLIPLTNPTVFGSGWNLADTTQILLDIGLDTPGGTWSMDEARILTTPEPSAALLTGTCLLALLAGVFRRRSLRGLRRP